MNNARRRLAIAAPIAAMVFSIMGPARATAPAYLSDPEYKELALALSTTKAVTATAAHYSGVVQRDTLTLPNSKVTMSYTYNADESVISQAAQSWDDLASAYTNPTMTQSGMKSVGGIGEFWQSLNPDTYPFQDAALAEQDAVGANYEVYIPFMDPYPAPAWASEIAPWLAARNNAMDPQQALVDVLTTMDSSAVVEDVTSSALSAGHTSYTVLVDGWAAGSPYVSKTLHFTVNDATHVVVETVVDTLDDATMSASPVGHSDYTLIGYGDAVTSPIPGQIDDEANVVDSGPLHRSVVRLIMADALHSTALDVATKARSAARAVRGAKHNKVIPAQIQNATRTMANNGDLGDSVEFRRTARGVRLIYSAFGQTVSFCVSTAPKGRVAVRAC
jgi:hypothetical protein